MKGSRPNCEGQWLDVPYLDSLHIAVHCSVADKTASEEGEEGESALQDRNLSQKNQSSDPVKPGHC